MDEIKFLQFGKNFLDYTILFILNFFILFVLLHEERPYLSKFSKKDNLSRFHVILFLSRKIVLPSLSDEKQA